MTQTTVDWIQTIKYAELEENRPTLTHARGLPVVLIRADDEIYALSNCCAHMGCPLADGLLEGDFLRCACHEWAFDIRTGELWEAPEVRIRTYPVKVAEEYIWIRPEVNNL
jgi:3-phenylpropionate/trans-cinnamate dioxygenase ferredoxin subunit